MDVLIYVACVNRVRMLCPIHDNFQNVVSHYGAHMMMIRIDHHELIHFYYIPSNFTTSGVFHAIRLITTKILLF